MAELARFTTSIARFSDGDRGSIIRLRHRGGYRLARIVAVHDPHTITIAVLSGAPSLAADVLFMVRRFCRRHAGPLALLAGTLLVILFADAGGWARVAFALIATVLFVAALLPHRRRTP